MTEHSDSGGTRPQSISRSSLGSRSLKCSPPSRVLPLSFRVGSFPSGRWSMSAAVLPVPARPRSPRHQRSDGSEARSTRSTERKCNAISSEFSEHSALESTSDLGRRRANPGLLQGLWAAVQAGRRPPEFKEAIVQRVSYEQVSGRSAPMQTLVSEGVYSRGNATEIDN